MSPPFHYFPYGTFLGLILSWYFAFVYASLSSLRIIFHLALNGSKYFQIKDRSGKNRPKVLDQYGNHKIVHLKKQNIKIHYVSNGRTDKPLMLFVHGFPECWYTWRHQMKAFDKDYHVVAMSPRGYCESDAPKGVSNYAIGEIVADIVELIELLVTKEHPKCVLVAHDWGGVLSWAVAHSAGALISKHIVMNAPHNLDWQEEVETSWIQFFRSWYTFLFFFPIIPELIISGNDLQAVENIFKRYSKSPEDVEAYKYCLSTKPYTMTAALNYYRAITRGYSAEFVNTFRLRHTKIEPDTLVIWAKNDKYLSSSLAEAGAKRCRKATIEYIEDCSHFLQLEQPEKVISIMKKHLP